MPTIAMEVILGLTPLHIAVVTEAKLIFLRLNNSGIIGEPLLTNGHLIALENRIKISDGVILDILGENIVSIGSSN